MAEKYLKVGEGGSNIQNVCKGNLLKCSKFFLHSSRDNAVVYSLGSESQGQGGRGAVAPPYFEVGGRTSHVRWYLPGSRAIMIAFLHKS